MPRKLDRNQKNQEGLVSLVIVSVIIIILALITLGFARIMDRQLRQALDNSLSSQAQYAAEAGINDARDYIKTVLSAGGDPTSDGCLDTSNPPGMPIGTPNPFANNGNISGNSVVKYTCVIINAKPKELKYDIKAGDSKVFKVILPAGSTLDNLYFSWQNVGATTSCASPFPAAPHNLPQESSFGNCNTGMLRAAVYPVPGSLSVPRPSDLQNQTLASLSRTYFMYPNSQSGGSPTTPGEQSYSQNGVFIDGNCNTINMTSAANLPFKDSTPRYCNSRVTNLRTTGAAFYYVRLSALYQDLSVSIQGSTSTNSPLNLGGAQASVDVTGTGNDVLKRLQASVPFESESDLPQYTIQSMSTLCKRFRVPKIGPNSFGAPSILDDPSGGTDQECKP